MYNAFEKDIAVVNIFFGKSTAIGTGIHINRKMQSSYRI